jgi:hypothetical protein
VQAATNEVPERSELPMMLYVHGTIVLLVLVTYRDSRAMIVCCLPLTLATFLGYWFMKALDIGLTVATPPVTVLAVMIDLLVPRRRPVRAPLRSLGPDGIQTPVRRVAGALVGTKRLHDPDLAGEGARASCTPSPRTAGRPCCSRRPGTTARGGASARRSVPARASCGSPAGG